jgi:DNA-binding NtrC family response regulator
MLMNGIKLLIVDDEIKFLDSIAQRLEMRDFDVTKATNGTDALEILKKEHKFLEVIILTGHGSLDSAVECTRLGAFDYLPKPYELEKLLDKLQKAYEARLQKKFEADQERMEKISKAAEGSSALEILRELRRLDDEEK